MAGSKPETNWPFVFNLANSIIGVAVLAFPLCFKQCGVILGFILLSGCAWLAYTSCCLLAKSASVSKKRSYEYLAFHTFGASGKLVVEVSSVGLLLGTLIAFFIIIGDICPEIISELFKIQNSTQLRTSVLLTLGLLVILPLCMKSNLESISNLSIMSLIFYSLVAIQVILSSVPHLTTGEFITDVVYWNYNGIFKSLPIFALSYACQIQLFLVYHSTPDISIKQVGGLVSKAIALSSTIYIAVGYFGYIAFYDKDVSGDILMSYETTLITGIIKLGFACSTILSFPLVVFPCRCSFYTLISARDDQFDENAEEVHDDSLHDNIGGNVHIPLPTFKYITCSIVVFTLIVGILVPKVEFVLGLTGSTLGSIICYILPAVMFFRIVTKDTPADNIMARAVLIIGVAILIISTWATLNSADLENHLVDLTDESENEFGLKEIHKVILDDAKPFSMVVTAPPMILLAKSSSQVHFIPIEENDLNYLKDVPENDAVNKGKVVHSNLVGDVIDDLSKAKGNDKNKSNQKDVEVVPDKAVKNEPIADIPMLDKQSDVDQSVDRNNKDKVIIDIDSRLAPNNNRPDNDQQDNQPHNDRPNNNQHQGKDNLAHVNLKRLLVHAKGDEEKEVLNVTDVDNLNITTTTTRVTTLTTATNKQGNVTTSNKETDEKVELPHKDKDNLRR